MNKMQQGFTLIELMIVIAIIGILAAIAIPAYQNYIIRAQVSEAPSVMAAAKTGVGVYYTNKGLLPANNGDAGVATAASIQGNYVESVAVGTNGVITATFGKDANAAIKLSTKNTFTLTPSTLAGSIVWHCGGTVEPTYLPSSCR